LGAIKIFGGAKPNVRLCAKFFGPYKSMSNQIQLITSHTSVHTRFLLNITLYLKISIPSNI